MNKSFDQSLCDANDAPAKKHTIELMRDIIGAELLEENKSEGTRGCEYWDLKFIKNGVVMITESEIKDSKWWGDQYGNSTPFKYDSMDIPARKLKNISKIFFIIISSYDYAFCVLRETLDILGEPKKKKTIYEPNGGDYISIDIKHGKFYKKIDGKWNRL